MKIKKPVVMIGHLVTGQLTENVIWERPIYFICFKRDDPLYASFLYDCQKNKTKKYWGIVVEAFFIHRQA